MLFLRAAERLMEKWLRASGSHGWNLKIDRGR